MTSFFPSQAPAPKLQLPLSFLHTSPPPEIITLGAEAHLYKTYFLMPTQPCALKFRPSKPYRHPILDKRLTRHRILSEARTMLKLRGDGVSVPGILSLDWEGGNEGKGGGWMMMEWIDGKTVKESMIMAKSEGENGNDLIEAIASLMVKIGKAVGRMHQVGAVHGDLTTSNMMLRMQQGSKQSVNGGYSGPNAPIGLRQLLEDGEIVLIDFGLAGQSVQDEDKAVDLYVLERAFGSTHPEAEEQFQQVLQAYGNSYKGAKIVLKRLEDVRMRGRKKSMIG